MSEKKKPIITLVGLKQARRDFLFLNEGPLKECENCALFKVCVSKLEAGRIYLVADVRDKIFPCPIHEEGVQVVEVVEPNIQANIESRLAFPYGIITFQSQSCKEASCPNHEKCVPHGIKDWDRCKVIEVKGQVVCPLSLRLVLAVLQRVQD
ncbi:MAG: UPF0179 family protein [Candidatus Bathyarchaeota archaeon]